MSEHGRGPFGTATTGEVTGTQAARPPYREDCDAIYESTPVRGRSTFSARI